MSTKDTIKVNQNTLALEIGQLKKVRAVISTASGRQKSALKPGAALQVSKGKSAETLRGSTAVVQETYQELLTLLDNTVSYLETAGQSFQEADKF